MAETDSNPIDEAPRIFWSWQSDKSPKTCRSFIRQCLADAINEIASSHNLHDADRPEIDHDTKGERGMTDITNTILSKIADAAVFVADLTPIGQSEGKKKWLPNPNVMIELGWAMHRPGWERVIGVLNTAHGASAEDLPFDIRQRRIITYILEDSSGASAKKAVREKLTKELKAAILVNLNDRAEELASTIDITGVAAKADNPSIWSSAEGSLIHGDPFGRSIKQEIGIPDVPRAYMRLIPSGWIGDAPSISDIAKHQSAAVDAPSTGASDGDFGATEEGYVRYWVTDRPEGGFAQASGMTMYFEDTGEFWTLHGNAVVNRQNQILIRDQVMLGHWSKTLRRSMKLFDLHGARKARLVEAGLFGVKDAKWFFEWESDRPSARRNDTKHSKQGSDWNDDAQLTFLTEAYNRVRNLFALERSTEAQVIGILKQFDPERFNETA